MRAYYEIEIIVKDSRNAVGIVRLPSTDLRNCLACSMR